MLSSKSPLLSGGGTTSERLARETNSIAPTNASASTQGMKDLGKSSHGSFQSDIKKTADKIPSSGNVMVKQSKQSDEGYGTDAKVSPTEQANSLLPRTESPSLPTVPEATLNQCQETNLSSNSQYDLGQLMRNQQQRKQQQQKGKKTTVILFALVSLHDESIGKYNKTWENTLVQYDLISILFPMLMRHRLSLGPVFLFH